MIPGRKATGRTIRYDVEIVGDTEPYKWQVKRTGDYNLTATTVTECKGEAESYTDAIFDAAACARASEARRRHSDTKRVEPLFEVSIDPEGGTEDEG